jgi:hypothetical protein
MPTKMRLKIKKVMKSLHERVKMTLITAVVLLHILGGWKFEQKSKKNACM